MITIVVNAEVKFEHVQNFIDATKKSQVGTLQEDGCTRYEILQNPVETNKFILIETYKNEDAINIHKETEHFKEWRMVTYEWMLVPRTSSKTITI